MRAIKQITSISGDDSTWPQLFALCDDGSVWTLTVLPSEMDRAMVWMPLPNVPQELITSTNEG